MGLLLKGFGCCKGSGGAPLRKVLAFVKGVVGLLLKGLAVVKGVVGLL